MSNNNLSMKDFQVVKELGSGSFGKVQLVKKNADQKLYAIKTVNMTRLNQKEKDGALNQVRLLASINLPYVIGYKGSFFNSETQSLCIIMEYADGGDLSDKINTRFKNNNGEGFEQNFIWKVAFQIFQGLKALHKNRIVHRDIKSANVFFVDGIAKLGDLNVSKVLENGMCSTQTGTPYYTSPQIWKGNNYGRKCDIWSTGCLLYQMCTLNHPFRARDIPGLYRKIIVGDYDPIPSSYSQDLSELIRMCLTVDEDLRPDASDLLDTTILSGMELSLQKFRQEEGSINLIDPIKCPRVLRFLNSKLPQAKQMHKGKKTGGFVTKVLIQFEKSPIRAKTKGKQMKNVRSQKIIMLNGKQTLTNNSLLVLGSKNIIKLPQYQKQSQEPNKFSLKKIGCQRHSGKLKGVSTSKKVIKINEKQNSIKLIEL